MIRAEPKHLLKRFDKAKAVKAQWRDLLSDAYEYALPQRNLYFSGDENNPGVMQGQKKVDRVFDSTAVNSTISFANRIQSDMMPPFQRWAKLESGSMVPEENKEDVDRVLEDATDQLFSVIQASNFDMSNGEALLDLAVGTAVMLVLEGDINHPINYVAVPASQVYLEEGAWGSVCGVYRSHKVEAMNLTEQWTDAKLPQSIKDIVQDPDKCDQKIDLVEATYHDYRTNKWCYDVILNKSKERIVERTYDENPWIVARWTKVAGEVYGRGPVIQALPDIKTINKITELVLKNAALHISGLYTGVDDGILNPNTVTLRPGTVIPVGSNGGARGPSLMALPRTGQFDLANMEHEKIQLSIKQMLLDNRLPPEAGPVRSATEIVERVKELSRDIGSPFSRLLQEWVIPMLQRTINIMVRRGLAPKIKIDGLAVQVRVVSPLAQEQNLNDVMTVVRWLTIVNSLGPEILHLSAKTEDVGDWLGEKLGVPNKLRRSTAERADLQKKAGMMAAQNGGIPMGSNTPGVELGAQAAGLPLQ